MAEASTAGGYQATMELLDRNSPVSAISAYNGTISAGCLKALREKKIQVPSDIFLIAVDDGIPCDYLFPELSVIKYPVEAMGEAAAQLGITLSDETSNSVAFEPIPELIKGKTVSNKLLN